MNEKLKQKIDDVLRFDADYIAQVIKGGSIIAQSKRQQQDALIHIIENMQNVIKELTEREAKLVAAGKILLSHLQGYNNPEVERWLPEYLKELQESIATVEATLSELGVK